MAARGPAVAVVVAAALALGACGGGVVRRSSGPVPEGSGDAVTVPDPDIPDLDVGDTTTVDGVTWTRRPDCIATGSFSGGIQTAVTSQAVKRLVRDPAGPEGSPLFLYRDDRHEVSARVSPSGAPAAEVWRDDVHLVASTRDRDPSSEAVTSQMEVGGGHMIATVTDGTTSAELDVLISC